MQRFTFQQHCLAVAAVIVLSLAFHGIGSVDALAPWSPAEALAIGGAETTTAGPHRTLLMPMALR